MKQMTSFELEIQLENKRRQRYVYEQMGELSYEEFIKLKEQEEIISQQLAATARQELLLMNAEDVYKEHNEALTEWFNGHTGTPRGTNTTKKH